MHPRIFFKIIALSLFQRANPSTLGRNKNYGQFSSIRESKNGEKDVYRLNGQDEDGKNTQIIINLSNEPKSYIGHHPDKNFKNDPEINVNDDIVPNDDFLRPPPLSSTIGPPGTPTSQLVGSPSPAPTQAPATTRPPIYGYRTTPPPIYYGSNSQAEPPIFPQPPPQNPPAAAPQMYTPNFEAPPVASPPQYGVPQTPQAPPQSYAPPAAAPQTPPSYGVPQAPPQAPPSYGVPQAPPQSYDPPAAAPPAPSYGAPPPADPIVQTQTQFVMPALTLSWQQPIIQQDIPQDIPQDKPSYGAPSNDPGNVQTQSDPDGGLHYHIHVDDVNDVQQLDEVR